MKKKLLLLILIIIFFISSITFYLIINYLDPVKYTIIAFSSLIFTFLLGFTSFVTVILYFFKKIYNRGDVYLIHVLTSFRQSFFLSLSLLGVIIFYNIGVPIILTSSLLIVMFILLELLLNNLKN